MTRRAVIDSVRGELRIGDTAVPIADAEPAGALRLFPPDGPVLRPISFGERFRLVERASASADPVESLCALVTRCATVSSASAALTPLQQSFCQTLALILAGADLEAPPFTESMLLVGGTAGWHYTEIENAEAARIDRLARRLEPKLPDPDDGWNRVVFEAEPEEDPESIRRDLAGRLLERFSDDPAVAEEGEAPDVFGEDRRSDISAPRRAWGEAPLHDDAAGAWEEDGEDRSGGRPELHGSAGALKTPGDDLLSRRDPSSAPADEEPDTSPRQGEPRGQRARVLGYRLGEWKRGDDKETSLAPSTVRAGEERAGPAVSRQGVEEPKPISGEMNPTGKTGAPYGGEEHITQSSRTEHPASSVAPVRPGARMPREAGDGASSTRSLPEPFAGANGRKVNRRDHHQPMPSAAPNPYEGGVPDRNFSGSPGEAGNMQGWAFPMAPSDTEHITMASPIPAAEGTVARPEDRGIASMIMEFADALAELLHEEADLRGIDR